MDKNCKIKDSVRKTTGNDNDVEKLPREIWYS